MRWQNLRGARCRIARSIREESGLGNARAVTPARCPFCPGRVLEVTPRFPPQLVAEGRLTRGDLVLFPNQAPYDFLRLELPAPGRERSDPQPPPGLLGQARPGPARSRRRYASGNRAARLWGLGTGEHHRRFPGTAWASEGGGASNISFVFEVVAPGTIETFEFDCTGPDGRDRGARDVTVEVSAAGRDFGFTSVLRASPVEGKAGQRLVPAKKIEGRGVRLTVVNDHGDRSWAELGAPGATATAAGRTRRQPRCRRSREPAPPPGVNSTCASRARRSPAALGRDLLVPDHRGPHRFDGDPGARQGSLRAAGNVGHGLPHRPGRCRRDRESRRRVGSLAPWAGLEPATLRLTAECSAD